MVLVEATLSRLAAICLLALALALGSGGCGSGQDASSASGDEEGGEGAAPAHYVSGLELRRQLGNAFDAGLYRLAVMSQPRDSATDLGQALPTGLLRTVSCDSAGAPRGPDRSEATRCTVAWETVDGRPRATDYVARLFPTGCFAAGADPRFPQHRDNTIESFSEHPLNALVSVARQCS